MEEWFTLLNKPQFCLTFIEMILLDILVTLSFIVIYILCNLNSFRIKK